MTLSIRARADASWGKERSGETTENSSEARPSLSQSSPTSSRRRHLKTMPIKPTGDEDRLVLLGVGRRRPVRMTAEIDVRERTESPVTMRVDEAAPQQPFAQIDVLIAPSPIAVAKSISRREMLTLHQDDAAKKNVEWSR
jgi:hypothetical protein